MAGAFGTETSNAGRVDEPIAGSEKVVDLADVRLDRGRLHLSSITVEIGNDLSRGHAQISGRSNAIDDRRLERRHRDAKALHLNVLMALRTTHRITGDRLWC